MTDVSGSVFCAALGCSFISRVLPCVCIPHWGLLFLSVRLGFGMDTFRVLNCYRVWTGTGVADMDSLRAALLEAAGSRW